MRHEPRTPSSHAQQSFFMRQLLFFIPLGITGFLLAFNGTIVNAGLARLPSPILLISSFTVARTFMQLIISPLHMIRPMLTALAKNGDDYTKVRQFAMTIAAAVTTVLAVFALSGLAQWTFSNLVGLPEDTVTTAVKILKLLILYPIGLFYKDFYHGVLIKFEKTSLITAATLIRIAVVGVIAYLITRVTFIPGTILAGIIYLSGAYSEGISAFLFSKKSIGNITKKLNQLSGHEHRAHKDYITGRFIFNFYWPLVITTYIKALAMPIINSGLAKASDPEMTITIFALTWGIIGNLNNPLNMFHQVSIRFTSENDLTRNKKVFQFGLFLGACMALMIALMSFTPFGTFIFEELIGVDHNVSVLSLNVLKYAIIIPIITVLREYFWGILIRQRNTRFLGLGKAINIITLISTMTIMRLLNLDNAATMALIAIILSDLSELIFIIHTFLKQKQPTLTPSRQAS